MFEESLIIQEPVAERSLPDVIGFYQPGLSSTATEETREACSDSDEDGWINPDNFEQVCSEMGGMEEVAMGVQVGCVTTDFAMQVCLYSMCRSHTKGEVAKSLSNQAQGV